MSSKSCGSRAAIVVALALRLQVSLDSEEGYLELLKRVDALAADGIRDALLR